MALIVCKNCGRQISDQVEECIHCGFSILKGNAEQESSQAKAEQKTKMIDFSDLPQAEQILIETEFLKTDKKMLKQRRKMQERSSCRKIGLTLYFITIVYRLFVPWYITNHLDGRVHDSNLYDLSSTILYLIAILSLIWILKPLFACRSMKKRIYQKKFQIWLEENKKISYVPTFISEKEKAIFESLDKESIKNH